MKIQIAFRDTGHVENGFRTVIATGLVEVPDSPDSPEVPEGMIGEFVLDMVKENGALRPSMAVDKDVYRTPKDRWGHRPWPETAVPGMVTESVWKSPWFNGSCELFLRRSLVEPSAEGLAVMCAAGLVALKGQAPVDQDSIFQLSHDGERFLYEGRIGEEVRPDWGKPGLAAAMRGEALAGFLRTPTWGFGDEPVGLGWHMSLEFAEAYDRYRTLALIDGRDEWDEREHEELLKRMSDEGMNQLDRDPAFRAYMKRMDGLGFIPRSVAMPETRTDLARRNRAAREVMPSILAAEDGPSMAP